jgi:hypothetical protein
MPGTPQPPAVQACNATHPTFLPVSVAEKNTVFDQLTVAEQLTIQAWMKEKEGIITDSYAKCSDISCHTIAHMVMIKPPKAEVMAWMAGTGPKPPRKAQFWHLKVRSGAGTRSSGCTRSALVDVSPALHQLMLRFSVAARPKYSRSPLGAVALPLRRSHPSPSTALCVGRRPQGGPARGDAAAHRRVDSDCDPC